MSSAQLQPQSETLFGHPTGLFTLFFAEMWERFSYYGMRALLVFYMIKGFLGYTDNEAYGVYGAYTALVYATPFIGGMLADRLLGARRAVVLGGLLMAAGHLAMTVENETIFFVALALLICGNGFFKPNISTIVGTLYPKGSPKKDAGFTIFYMGINLGAAMSPVICGYVGETYGWHYGFGLATAGMLIGVAVFVAPTRLTQVLILGGALATAAAMPLLQDTMLQLVVRLILSVSLAVAGLIAFLALGRGGIPDIAGAAPSEDRLTNPAFPQLKDHIVTYYLAIIASVLTLQLLAEPSSMEAWMLAGIAGAAIVLPWVSARGAVFVCTAASIPTLVLLVRRGETAGYLLFGAGAWAFWSLIQTARRSNKIERERLYVVLILMFFSMLFWAFFEQAGSSVNNFTDRNIDRVIGDREIADDDCKKAEDGTRTITFRVQPRPDDDELSELPLLSQEQLGFPCDDEVFERVDRARKRQKAEKEKEEAGKETSKENAELDPEEVARIAQAAEDILKEIKKDDAAADNGKASVSLAVAPSKTAEDGDAALVYTFTRTGKTDEALSVRFEVSGTAEVDKDFEHKGAVSFSDSSGSVTIPAGQTEAKITVDPKEDEDVEENETIVLVLASADEYDVDTSKKVTATIENDDKVFTMTHLSILRDEAGRDEATDADKTITWTITEDHATMRIFGDEIPASEYQAANPIYIIVFGLVFSALWGFLSSMGLEPSTPVKFALGLMQLGLAFGMFWYGAHVADERGMVAMGWLLGGYLLQTTGELCLSPVGLSMVTKLSPGKIVSTVMGAWFLATAFSNYLAGIIATFTGVEHTGDGEQVIPAPIKTLTLYGDVFWTIAIAAIVSGIICLALAPLLSQWMHPEVDDGDSDDDG